MVKRFSVSRKIPKCNNLLQLYNIHIKHRAVDNSMQNASGFLASRSTTWRHRLLFIVLDVRDTPHGWKHISTTLHDGVRLLASLAAGKL
jgi:hypothetical protein